jgi:NAD+ kinase
MMCVHMEKVSRAFVIANRKKPVARKIKTEVASFLSSRGVRISASAPQLVITVGGDGTVLFSKKYYGVPFFAIGSSTSFMCQADFSNWKGKLQKLLGRMGSEQRLLIDARLGGRKLPLSLNEIGIRNPEPRVLSVYITAGRAHYAFRADGVIFSTPTGSPAYCYSCGGSQMKKTEQRYQVVAISPFRRLFSPLILPAGETATMRISGHERAQLFIDGQVVGSFTEKNTLRIRGSRTKFLFAKA